MVQHQQQQHWSAVVDLIHRGPWWKNKGMVKLNFILLLPLLTSAINGYDSSLLNGLQLLPSFIEYYHLGKTSQGFANAAQNFGAFLALLIAPFISDGLGRRKSLCVGSIIMVCGVALQCTAMVKQQFIAARGIIGFGLNIALNAAPLLLTEMAYPTQRGQYTSMYNSIWYFGSVIAAWSSYIAFIQEAKSYWAWRIPSIIQAFPSVAQLILVWFIPESPRWLISRGRVDEARVILAKYHANNGDVRDPLVAFEVTQIQHALRMEKELAKSTTYLTLFSTPGNRRRMRIVIAIALFSQWSGNGLISYYIGNVLSSIGIGTEFTGTKGQINGSLQSFNLVVAVCASLLVERLGRRTLFLASNTGMLIIFTLFTTLAALFGTNHKDETAKIASIALIFFFYLFYDLAYTPLLISYCIEILPFNIRAKGFAVMNMVVCLSLAFNQFVNPTAMANMQWKYYLVYIGWLAFELVFVIRYVIETKGRTLEETAALFDGEQPALELQQLGHEAATLTLNELQAANLRFRLEARLEAGSQDKLAVDDLDRTESSLSTTLPSLDKDR